LGFGKTPHGISKDQLSQIDRQIANPLMVFTSKTRPQTSLVFLTEIKDAQDGLLLYTEKKEARTGFVPLAL